MSCHAHACDMPCRAAHLTIYTRRRSDGATTMFVLGDGGTTWKWWQMYGRGGGGCTTAPGDEGGGTAVVFHCPYLNASTHAGGPFSSSWAVVGARVEAWKCGQRLARKGELRDGSGGAEVEAKPEQRVWVAMRIQW